MTKWKIASWLSPANFPCNLEGKIKCFEVKKAA